MDKPAKAARSPETTVSKHDGQEAISHITKGFEFECPNGIIRGDKGG